MISTQATTCSFFVVLGGDDARIVNSLPKIHQNSLVPIVVKTSNKQAAENYFTYHKFLKSSYSDISALCKDIDRAEHEIGEIQGPFYPVPEGTIENQRVRMVYTLYSEIQPLFSSKTTKIFRKVTSLRDALVFMATSGDPNQLKGLKPWKIPEKLAVAQPDEKIASPPHTPQKEKAVPQIPPSHQTPSGKSRPKCKNCKQYMLGHDKVACAALKSSSSTTLSPSTSSRRSVSSPTEKECGQDSDDKGGGIDDLVDLFRGLRSEMGELNRSLRREQEERKADSASHKEESARLKEESARSEALRKKETERLEALRMKDRVDAEKRAEEQMKRFEAVRKKETERFEALRKNETERLEALRKKDIEDLGVKIEHLEQLNIEREDHWKQKYESTQRYIECLASDIDATTDFLAVGDEAGLDRIKRRNLLDRAQASLALSLGLSDKSYSASIQFRETLNRASSLEERQQRLLEILTEKKDELPSQAALLITKPEALKLLAEQYPRVRLDGDQVAHGHRERSWYEGAVFRSVGKDKIALTSLLDYVSPAAR